MSELPPPLPDRAAPPRLPRTYTVGHERDANPQIGRVVLVVLAVICLGLQGAEFAFLPHASVPRLLAAALRVGVSWLCLIALAAGLGWARWPLAVLHVGLGLWLEVHAMMGTFAAAYPGISDQSSLVPMLLGALFLGAGGWFGLSADLSAYLDRERAAGVTNSSRLITAALLAVAVGLPAVGFVTLTVLTPTRLGSSTSAPREPDSVPLPTQNDEGGRFALDLIQWAVKTKDLGVVTVAMSPELRAQAKPEWTQRVSADLARRGPPLGFQLSDVTFNQSIDQRRELTYCNVFAVYSEGRVCFHFYLSRNPGAKEWQVDTFFIE